MNLPNPFVQTKPLASSAASFLFFLGTATCIFQWQGAQDIGQPLVIVFEVSFNMLTSGLQKKTTENVERWWPKLHWLIPLTRQNDQNDGGSKRNSFSRSVPIRAGLAGLSLRAKLLGQEK